jgi:hypothetical protein
MKMLMLSVLGAGCLLTGANVALADEDSQAGSAWRDSPLVPYGAGRWPPVQQAQPQPRVRAPLAYGDGGAGVPQYAPQYSTAPHYPYTRTVPVAPVAPVVPVGPRTERDRDGDGVPNRRDAYPDDPARR